MNNKYNGQHTEAQSTTYLHYPGIQQFVEEHNLQDCLEFCRRNQETESQKLMSTLLTNALHRRLQTGHSDEHIYLKNDEVPQIQLFNILIEQFPFVKYSQLISNNAILETIGDATEATIIDIGIGQGVQMVHLMEAAKNSTTLKKIHIIGIEPFADALQLAEQHIRAVQDQVPFEIEFTGYHNFIEEFNFSNLRNNTENLVVNASLALHHIPSIEKREAVITAIKALNPKAFFLIEPNTDHYEKNLSIRFMNCYHHYYNIFDVIDRLDIEAGSKTGLKLFFGREIEDVIGKAENDRFEKHERASAWIARLEHAGFHMNPGLLKSPVESAVGVQIRTHEEGFLGFTNRAETVLAVLCAN